MPHVRRFSIPAAGLTAFAVLAGCGSVTYDKAKVQSAVSDVLTKQAGVQVQSVKCPDNAKIAKGVVIDCVATLVGGDTVRFTATETDDQGHVHVGPAEMIAAEVQNKIASALKQRGVTAIATCPQHVPIVVGQTFVCTATDKAGRHAKIGITIRSTSAGFSMRVVG
jgi:hypothetical protein